MSSSIWNLLNPLRAGFVKVAPSGRELYGTVIKHGLNVKTVTVRADFQFWNTKYRKYYHSFSTYVVHDEKNFCVSGDKVVIRGCRPVSERKHYYIRNVVKKFARSDYYKPAKTAVDKKLDQEYKKLLKYYINTEMRHKYIKNRKQEANLKRNMKRKALSRAIQNLKRIERVKEPNNPAITVTDRLKEESLSQPF